MINEFITKFRDLDVRDTLIIIMYELGDLSKSVAKGMRHPQLEKAYRAEMQIAISDLFTQIISVCEMYGWHYEDLIELGVERVAERAEERMEDKKKGEYIGH